MSITVVDIGTQRYIISRCLSSSVPSQTDLGWSDSSVQYNVMTVIYDDINIAHI